MLAVVVKRQLIAYLCQCSTCYLYNILSVFILYLLKGVVVESIDRISDFRFGILAVWIT